MGQEGGEARRWWGKTVVGQDGGEARRWWGKTARQDGGETRRWWGKTVVGQETTSKKQTKKNKTSEPNRCNK